MSIVIKRKTKPKKCPRCRVGGYAQDSAHDGRPSFTCTKCGHSWTAGKDGGSYAKGGTP